jgi:polyhydroxyalkanoate synthase subunit PhaC
MLARETGQMRVVLAGHSLGGTLAAIFPSLHPERVRGLALLEAPTKFGRDAGPSRHTLQCCQ